MVCISDYLNELNKITHNPAIIEMLTKKGIMSLEQIVLAPESMLGLSGQKAKQVVESAKNELAKENIDTVHVVSNMEVKIVLKNYNTAILESTLFILGADKESYNLKKDSNTIILLMKSGKRNEFKKIIKNANSFMAYLDQVRSVEMINEGITLPEEEIRKFAKEKKFNGFFEEFFSDIVGNELAKKAIAISLFSTFEEPVNVLILGDPGSAKTLARDILIKNLSGINSVGANATKAGLVCNLSNGELGALAVSDKKVVIIDEFDKINQNDLEFCYELMSNGRCSVHSARVHKDIKSNFILIAFGNPKSNVFSKITPLSDIGMERTLLSRFALIIKTETLTQKQKEDLFKKIFRGESSLSTTSGYFDQWVKLGRKYNPKIVVSEEKIDSLVKKIVDIVELHATTQLRRDLRMGLYLRRIAMSLARMEFRDVDEEILERAYDVIEESVKIWNFRGGNLNFLETE